MTFVRFPHFFFRHLSHGVVRRGAAFSCVRVRLWAEVQRLSTIVINHCENNASENIRYTEGTRTKKKKSAPHLFFFLSPRQGGYTGWFKLNTSNRVSHECRVPWLLECHIIRKILTAMNGGRGWHARFFVRDLGLAQAAKTYPHRPQSFK